LSLARRATAADAVRTPLVGAAHHVAASAVGGVGGHALTAAGEQAAAADTLAGGAHLADRTRVATDPAVLRIGGDARARAGARRLTGPTGDAGAPRSGRDRADAAGARERRQRESGAQSGDTSSVPFHREPPRGVVGRGGPHRSGAALDR